MLTTWLVASSKTPRLGTPERNSSPGSKNSSSRTTASRGKFLSRPQEDDGREDSGPVILNLRTAAQCVYMEPRSYDDTIWEVTLTEQPNDLVMSVHDIASLAAELVMAGRLCTFLQWRSLEWDRDSGRHGV